MKANVFLILLLSIATISCADKIDGTSKESYRNSLDDIKSKLKHI